MVPSTTAWLSTACPQCLKMAKERRHREHEASGSRASSSGRWASFPLVRAAPCFFGNRPSLHPIGKSSVTIVGLGRRHATSATLIWAALAVDTTAPLLLRHRPARLPIRKTIGTIVRVRGRRWDGCWQHDGRRRRCHRWRRCDDHRWGGCRWATTVVNPATPSFLVGLPRVLRVNGTIEWIACRPWAWRRCRRRPRWGLCGWRCRGRCGRWRWEGCRWHRQWRLWQCRGHHGRRTTCSHRHAAIILLGLRPSSLDHCGTSHTDRAIVGLRR